MRILVTGAAGFIGSHLVERLLQLKHDVVGMDNFDPFYDPATKHNNLSLARDHATFTLIQGDLFDHEALQSAFAGNGFDVVVHLAAKAGVRPSIDDPIGYYRTNVEGTVRLLEMCKNQGVKKFIFASSSSVYGNNVKVPFSESDVVDYPISPYAASKKAGELICYNYHCLYGIDVFALRLFTVYGPRQRPDMAIHKFTRLMDAGKTIPVYGGGKLRRDFTFVDDIVHGLLNAINSVAGYQIINLGESTTISVSELIRLIEESLGKKANIQMLPIPPGDVNETFADIGKARELIGYRPKMSIDEGIRIWISWYLREKERRESTG